MKCEIRKAKIEDVSTIQDLLKQLGYESCSSELEKSLSQNSADHDVYVAVTKHQTVALISLIYFYYFPLQNYICRITAIAVDEPFRGTGVGTMLIKFAQEKALNRSCAQLEVTTSLLREKTQKYYETIGFTKSSFRYFKNIDTSQVAKLG